MGEKLQDISVKIDKKKLLFGAMCGINYLHQKHKIGKYHEPTVSILSLSSQRY